MSESRGDVVVVGAGLIGLAIAFELAERGASVRVFDRAEPGRAASWAGAGMLAPYAEAAHNDKLLELCIESLREYPAFVQRAIAAGGCDPQLQLGGVAHAAFDELELERLRRTANDLSARGVECAVLDRNAMLAAEPWLGPRVTGGMLVSGEGCVDNRRLGRSLVGACETRGVTIARVSELALECDGRRVLGVATDLGFIPARAVVNACGAWSGDLPGVPEACRPPIEPVKGQMLALAVPDALAHRPTWLPGAYVVPREDGRLLVGATAERAGFDQRVTAAGIESLLAAVLAAAPGLADFTVTETWAGLRPGTPDGLPFLGETPLEGFFLATGHFRNGILLAPVTARLVADAVEGRSPAQLTPFSLARIGNEGVRSQRITSA